MLHPTLKCPKHGFAFVSMPRWEENSNLENEEWEWKCPLTMCLHGVRREERDFDIQSKRDFKTLEDWHFAQDEAKEGSSLE